MNKEIHIACSTDDNYAPLCGVMVCSALENNKGGNLVVHVLTNSLSADNRDRMTRQCSRYGARCLFHQIDESRLEGCQYRTKVHPLSSAAYYRILLASVLPDVSRAIYLDCDMMVLDDLRQIYDTDLEGRGVAAVQDYDTPADMAHYQQLGLSMGDRYFNSGFMVIDLDYWRKHNTENQLLAFAKRPRKVYFHDQDALNSVFANQWKRLSPEWNHFNVARIRVKGLFENKDEAHRFFSSPKVVHFPGRHFKPWLPTPLIPYRRQWLHYLEISAWRGLPMRHNDRPYYTLAKSLFVEMERLYYKLRYIL